MVRSPRRDRRRAFLSSLLPVIDLRPPSSSATLQGTDLGPQQPATAPPSRKRPVFEPGACRSREGMGRSAAAPALPAALAAETLRAVPDQAVAGALIVHDQVGEDRGGKARIIEPDLVVAPAALLRRLGPGSAELDAVGKEAEGGSALVVGGDRLQGDLGQVEGQRLDLALEEAVLGRGEGADGGHCLSPVRFVSGPPLATLMVIDKAGGASARIAQRPEQRGGRRAPTVLVREECVAGPPQRGVDAKGKRVGASRCGADARRQPSLGQITPIKTQTGAPNDDPSTG